MQKAGKESKAWGRKGNLSSHCAGQRFKSAIGLVLFQLIGFFLIFGFIGCILYFVFINKQGNPFQSYVIAFGLIMAALLILPKKVITIIVTEKEIVFSRFGKPYLVFPAGEFVFGSFILRRTINGLPFFTSRYLRVICGQRFADYPCYNFSKKTHAALIAAVSGLAVRQQANNTPYSAELKAQIAAGGNAQADYGQSSAITFSSPYGAIVPALQKRARQIIVSMLAISFALLVLYYFTVFRPANIDNTGMLILTAVLLLVCFVLIPGIWQRRNVSAFERKTPSVITIENGTLRIDADNFELSRIEDLKMTPPGYKASSNGFSIKRRMVIRYCGARYEYWFGHTLSAPYMYSDYAALCAQLETALSPSRKFIYDI